MFFSKISVKKKLGIFVVFFFVGCAVTKNNIAQYETEKNLARLIQIYTGNDPLKIRYWALKSIGRLNNPEAIPYLLRGLEEKHWILREEAVHSLGNLRDKKAMPALIQALNDPSILVRLEATNVAIEIGKEKDTSELETALYDANPQIREKVAYILGCIGNNKSLPALLEAIDDPDAAVRQSVISALAKFNDDTATEVLIKTLKDTSWKIRREAVISLGKLGSFQAIDSLKPLIKYDPSDMVRQDSKIALNLISQSITKDKCNKCHSYYEAIAVRRTPGEWKEIIWRMMVKDKEWMNEKETRLITEYLVQHESTPKKAEEEQEEQKYYAVVFPKPARNHQIIR